jgi:hypothetical protein
MRHKLHMLPRAGAGHDSRKKLKS